MDKLEKQFIKQCEDEDLDYMDILHLYVESYKDLKPPAERLLVATSIKYLLSKVGDNNE